MQSVIRAYENPGVFPEGLDIDRRKTCCFTGHRPKGIPGGGAPGSPAREVLKKYVEQYVILQMGAGKDTFMTGMASGFDLLAASVLIESKNLIIKPRIICAVPFNGQINKLENDWEKQLYCDIMNASFTAVCLSHDYKKDCYKVRNQFMVDCSSAIIAYVSNPNVTRSGSAQTLRMARRAHLEEYLITREDLAKAGI